MIRHVPPVLVALALMNPSPASAGLAPRPAEEAAIRDDVDRILAKADLPPGLLRIRWIKTDEGNGNVTVSCAPEAVELEVRAPADEWGPTLYLALQKLGFLFPHPRIQVSPSKERILSVCGQTFAWQPRFRYRGYHLHAIHPSEWVDGFFTSSIDIGEDIVRWVARNSQNVLELVLMRTVPFEDIRRYAAPSFALGQRLGLVTGASVSFAHTQQKDFRLVAGASRLTGIGQKKAIEKSLKKIMAALPVDYVATDLGTTEFTTGGYERTLKWLEWARATLEGAGKKLFSKVHVSNNQVHPKWGNYNFLAQYSSPEVGIFPHSVMFYHLEDQYTPVYGRQNFDDIRAFLEQEAPKRETWTYPETSYWCAMDVDVPIFLTDYLGARSRDLDYAERVGLRGAINFTTGHELGYWLFDWTWALLMNAENRGDPMAGLKLLGEDPDVWAPILEFQTRFFKDGQLIREISTSNLMDEMPFLHRLHDRWLLRELEGHPERTAPRLAVLEAALAELPSLDGVRNPELRAMLNVTWLRTAHAAWLRRALLHPKKSPERKAAVGQASLVRAEARKAMNSVVANFDRYPAARNFSRPKKNPTSYNWGYVWPAASLVWWEREEKMIERASYSPFFMNVYDFVQILF